MPPPSPQITIRTGVTLLVVGIIWGFWFGSVVPASFLIMLGILLVIVGGITGNIAALF